MKNIKDSVEKMQPSNIELLEESIKIAGKEITQPTICSLIEHAHNNLKECIKNNGLN